MGTTMRRMKQLVPATIMLTGIGTLSAGGIASACNDNQGNMQSSYTDGSGQSGGNGSGNSGQQSSSGQYNTTQNYSQNTQNGSSSSSGTSGNSSSSSTGVTTASSTTNAQSNDQANRMYTMRATLRSDMQEHAAFTVPALQAELEQTANREELMAVVDQNSQAVARDITSMMYMNNQTQQSNATQMNTQSPSTATQQNTSQDTQGYNDFLNLWRSHINYYRDYVHATRANDATAKNAAKQNLAGFTDKASTWLAGHNSGYDKAEVQQALTTHGNQVVAIVDAMAAKDYTAAYNTAHQAYQHMGMVADYLSGGMNMNKTSSTAMTHSS